MGATQPDARWSSLFSLQRLVLLITNDVHEHGKNGEEGSHRACITGFTLVSTDWESFQKVNCHSSVYGNRRAHASTILDTP